MFVNSWQSGLHSWKRFLIIETTFNHEGNSKRRRNSKMQTVLPHNVKKIKIEVLYFSVLFTVCLLGKCPDEYKLDIRVSYLSDFLLNYCT